jgi:hypothetical protein
MSLDLYAEICNGTLMAGYLSERDERQGVASGLIGGANYEPAIRTKGDSRSLRTADKMMIHEG